jgi:protein-tyrosine phosphatase
MCTGNICRSPMAEALLRQRLSSRGVTAHVSSAGLLLEHEPADAHAVEVMAGLGLDLTGHRSRILDASLAAGTDLLIGMEQRHIREAVLLQPDVFPRAFTLPDLVARAEATGPRGAVPFPDWLAELGQDRRRVDVFRQDRRLEVADPIGGSRRAFRRTADQLADLLDRFVALAWSDDPATGHH